MIPYGRQSIVEADIEAVVEVLRSELITQGPVRGRFEGALAAYCEAPHAVAVSHGTAALHLACLAIGVKPGDLVWTSPNSFPASANCARYCGADVDFVDVDPATGNLSIAALEAKLSAADAVGRLPALLIPVHYAGQCCDLAAIARLAKRYGFRVIEDACHALGARFEGERVGACRYSDMAVFSFHPLKSITTGEGGAVTTRDPELAARLSLFASHGITRDAARLERPDEGGWYYEQVELGFNFRLTEIQAALGLSQIGRLDEMLKARRVLAGRYHQCLADLPLERPEHRPHEDSAWHLYAVQLDAGRRRQVYNALQAAGIGVQVHYIPVHFHPYYRRLGFRAGDFPGAEQHYRSTLTLPLHPTLTAQDQDRVIETLKGVLRAPPA